MTPLTIGLIVVAATVLPLAVMLWLAFTAPRGWEDERGWNEGEP